MLFTIGSIHIKLYRPIEGEFKTCALTHNASRVYVPLSCEEESKPLLANEKAVGIDLGIENWACLSDGDVIENPRFFKQEEKALTKVQRKLA